MMKMMKYKLKVCKNRLKKGIIVLINKVAETHQKIIISLVFLNIYKWTTLKLMRKGRMII